ncbi:MAG: hypothetical protein CMB64_02545 [Euryarchaeota archaeon]|nr:hypothetical protein [Euryarchaeota archaeon]
MRRRVTVPARINIIGEHTDYGGGLSLPFAINSFLILDVVKQENGYSGDDTVISLWKEAGGWPAKITLNSEIPIGKGLSSSAALCLAIVIGKNGNMNPFDTCKEAQRIEHKILKTKCGLLDQMAIMYAIKNQVTLIDFKDNSIHHHKIPNEWKFKLIDSGIERKLKNTKYNNHTHIDESHVIEESNRVRLAINAPPSELGKLLNKSHSSLIKLGVSIPIIDEMVNSIQKTKGVLGARMMGGGFGGMILVLVENENILPEEKLVISSGPPTLEELF